MLKKRGAHLREPGGGVQGLCVEREHIVVGQIEAHQ
jgi:hypothetical protein